VKRGLKLRDLLTSSTSMPPENESEDLKRESRDSANLTATIFAIVVSGTACVFNIVGRNGLELGALTTMRLFSLCLILICAPKILALYGLNISGSIL